MNQKNRSKISLFFAGFSQRYENNRDYFIGIDFDLISGAKNYAGRITAETDGFCCDFAGKRRTADLPSALALLTEEILRYDGARVRYRERGSVTELIADAKSVRLQKGTETREPKVGIAAKKKTETVIELHRAARLMKVLGYTDENGKLKNDMIRKYNQTNHILTLIDDLFDGMQNITVVDCACGKSYLSFVLNYYLWEIKHIRARFVGIDISEQVIRDSREMARELGYSNMEFICTDLRTYESDFHPDLVMSLHACDTATDMALGYALRHRAERIVCVPCCHKELLKQYRIEDFEPITKHGIFRARLNDLLTDGLRAMKLEAEGYDVSCIEFCSPLDTPKNLLIRAKLACEKREEIREKYRRLLDQWNVRPSLEYYAVSSVTEDVF